MSRVRAAGTLADQIASSASNTLIVLAIAQVATVEEFGSIALYFAVLTLALAVVRGAFGRLLLLSSSKPVKSAILECSLASTAALLASVPTILLLGLIGAATQDITVFLVFAAACPVLLLQDIQRHAALARMRPYLALLWDGAWAAGSATMLLLTWFNLVFTTPAQLVAGWAALASITYVGLALTSRAWPGGRLILLWLRRQSRLRLHYAAEASIGALATLILFAASTYLAGEHTTAALRGASTLFGPISVMMSALPLFLLPAVARDRSDMSTAWRSLRPATLGLSCIALLNLTLMVSLPDKVGRLLLGGAWKVTQPIVAFTGIEYAAVVWLSAVFTCLISARMGAAIFKARLSYSIMTLTFAITAMVAFRDARVIALAMTLSAVIATALAVVALTRHSRTSSRILKTASSAGPQRNHEDAARGRATS